MSLPLRRALQSDVLAALHGLFVERLEEAQDFDDLIRLHEDHVARLMQRTFRRLPPVRNVLDDVLNCCLELCDRLIKYRTAHSVPPREVLQLDASFRAKTGFLFKILANVDDPHLAQLLLRINYNKVMHCGGPGGLGTLFVATDPLSLVSAVFPADAPQRPGVCDASGGLDTAAHRGIISARRRRPRPTHCIAEDVLEETAAKHIQKIKVLFRVPRGPRPCEQRGLPFLPPSKAAPAARGRHVR